MADEEVLFRQDLEELYRLEYAESTYPSPNLPLDRCKECVTQQKVSFYVPKGVIVLTCPACESKTIIKVADRPAGG